MAARAAKVTSEIGQLKGIGPARGALLEAAGIRSLEDLLYYLPRRYLDRTLAQTTAFRAGLDTTVIVTVQSAYLAHGKRSRLVVTCRTLAGEPLSLVFFRGVMYFKRVFQKDLLFVVSGKLEFFGGMQMVHPDFEELDSEDSETIHVGRVVPVYPGTEELKKKGLDSRGFRRILHQVFEDQAVLPDLLPDSLLSKFECMKRMDALRNIHFPESAESLNRARYSLKFEELYLF